MQRDCCFSLNNQRSTIRSPKLHWTMYLSALHVCNEKFLTTELAKVLCKIIVLVSAANGHLLCDNAEPDFDSSTLSGTHNNSISTDDDLLTSL